MEDFLAAAADLASAHNEQVKAMIEDDPDFSRFNLLIHFATERTQRARYCYVSHLEQHGC